jgi:peroxiredoxin
MAGMAASPIVLPALDGKPVTLEPAGPTPKLVVFYKVSCPTCQFGMPFYNRLYRAFADSPVTVVAVAQNRPVEAADFAARYEVTMPQLIDAPAFAVSKAYQVMTVPTLFVIDAAGEIALASPGFVRADLERAAALLAAAIDRPVPEIFRPDEAVPALKPG